MNVVRKFFEKCPEAFKIFEVWPKIRILPQCDMLGEFRVDTSECRGGIFEWILSSIFSSMEC